MLLLTKATMPLLVILFIFWLCSFWALRHHYLNFSTLKTVLRLAALIIGIGLITSPWWFRERDIVSIYFLAAALTFLGTEAVIASFSRWDDDTLLRIRRIIWLSLTAVILTFLVRNIIAHVIAPRPRPFNDINLDWNFLLRSLRDERVVYGSSYVSGHASTVFALIIAPCWFIHHRGVRVGLILWAFAVSYSRLYLAAHYPYCVFVAALLGTTAGAITTFILAPKELWKQFRIQSFVKREPEGEP